MSSIKFLEYEARDGISLDLFFDREEGLYYVQLCGNCEEVEEWTFTDEYDAYERFNWFCEYYKLTKPYWRDSEYWRDYDGE